MTACCTLRVAMFVIVLTMGGQLANAQEVATTFDQLRVLVRPGDTVAVVDASGTSGTGQIVSVTSTTLSLLVGSSRRSFSEGDLRSVSQSRRGNLAKGAKIGFGVGAAFGLVVGLAAASENHGADDPGAGFAFLAAAVYGGIGSGVGVGISAASHSQHVIYRTSGSLSSSTLVLSPLLTRRGAGAALSFGF